MTRLLFALALLTAPAALAQTVPPAHALPFPAATPETHTLELAVGGTEGEALQVAVVAAPDWLVFAAPSAAAQRGSAATPSEPVAHLAFSVDPSAPVGEAATVDLVVTDGDGTERARHTVRLVVAAPELSLAVPAPNPSRSGASVRFTTSGGAARLSVLDVLGREIAVLADGDLAAGAHRATVPRLAAGTYLVRLVTDDAARTTRFTVVR